ncbi:hypothetical protein G1H11_04580 [Phytoactinopolyspora alkaliphila]|uniref:Uncharacterized protein n=1 Tax=Phytoactinopolyspora alkaliphila TaxID=1783498 RepID=A0A6N9YHV4_9ACTN|nr:hypothetical protein [Phytoactinopolyspora alkaliphila]NED94583.1 hypothetical protein [Phytoactinopolyspora alkaliphila]
MSHFSPRTGPVRRSAVVACGAAVAMTVGAFGVPAGAVDVEPAGDLEVSADGYYGSVRFDFGGGLPLLGEVAELKGDLTVGAIQNNVDSGGLEGYDEGVYTRSFGSLVAANVAGVDLPVDLYAVEQVALPEEAEADTYGIHELEVPLAGSLSAISGEAKANWNDETYGHGSPGGVLTSLYSGVGQVDLVDLTELGLLDGMLGNLLPVDLPIANGPLISVGAGQLLQESGVFGKEDGTQGAYAEVSGRFADLNLLGGAANGGVTLGLAAASDTETPNAYGRLEVTGEPGGASFDYDLPALELWIGDEETGIAVEPGFDQTFDILPGVSLNINFADYRNDDTELAEDGTYAAASGGGLSARLTVAVPVPLLGEIEVGTAEIGLLSFPEISVEVPEGGLHADGAQDDEDDFEVGIS